MQEVAADVVSSVTHRRGGQQRRTWPAHGLGKWEVPAEYKFSRQRGRRRR